jgi:HEAT repeat protein
MKRLPLVAALLAVGVVGVAQDAAKILETFQRNFAIASIEVKIQMIQEAAAGPNARELGPLFQQAVDFVLDNISIADTDARVSQLGGIAAEQIGAIGYTAARSSLMHLFLEDADASVRARCAVALGKVGAGDADIVENLNRFLDSQNSIAATGAVGSDVQAVPAVLQTLGTLADPSSFPVIFTAMNVGYSAQVSRIAQEALLAIKGDFRQMVTEVIRTAPAREKGAALQMALSATRLSAEDKAEVATFALDVGLHVPAATPDEREPLRAMRYTAVAALRGYSWSKATGLLIEHLDMTIMEVDRFLADRGYLLDAIAALGAMGNHEAAVRLTQYLVLLNSYTEQGKVYDEVVVGAVIDSLGELGDKVAFDDLMYTQYLNYSNTIKKEARTALNQLKW